MKKLILLIILLMIIPNSLSVISYNKVTAEIIGKPVLYNQILFKTTANYDLTDCEILINANTYNMSLANKFAYYDYYIQDDGLYEWEVTCE